MLHLTSILTHEYTRTTLIVSLVLKRLINNQTVQATQSSLIWKWKLKKNEKLLNNYVNLLPLRRNSLNYYLKKKNYLLHREKDIEILLCILFTVNLYISRISWYNQFNNLRKYDLIMATIVFILRTYGNKYIHVCVCVCNRGGELFVIWNYPDKYSTRRPRVEAYPWLLEHAEILEHHRIVRTRSNCSNCSNSVELFSK